MSMTNAEDSQEYSNKTGFFEGSFSEWGRGGWSVEPPQPPLYFPRRTNLKSI